MQRTLIGAIVLAFAFTFTGAGCGGSIQTYPMARSQKSGKSGKSNGDHKKKSGKSNGEHKSSKSNGGKGH